MFRVLVAFYFQLFCLLCEWVPVPFDWDRFGGVIYTSGGICGEVKSVVYVFGNGYLFFGLVGLTILSEMMFVSHVCR